MLTALFFLLLVIFISCRPNIRKGMLPNAEYITHERTSLINGFFIWIVFSNHLIQYAPDYTLCDKAVAMLLARMGQNVVATFLFFSGYGIMFSLRNKKRYANTLVKKRFLSLLLHMTLAILVFLVVQTMYGKEYDISTVLLACTGWFSIGNSNWFIFVTLACYLIIFLSYVLWHKRGESAVIISTIVLLAVLIYFLRQRGGWWIDSCMCVPAGMLFFTQRTKIENFIARTGIPVSVFGITLILFGLISYLTVFFPIAWLRNISTVSFGLGVCLLFSCIHLQRKPRFLCWCGGPALFSLFIFQRIPMMVGRYEEMNTNYPQIYIFLCIVLTLVLGWLGMKFFYYIDRLIFKNEKKLSAN